MGEARGAALAVARFPLARFVYTGSTAVYADADGNDRLAAMTGFCGADASDSGAKS